MEEDDKYNGNKLRQTVTSADNIGISQTIYYNSPTPPVLDEKSCNPFLISSITTPTIGPNANAPIRAGKSDRSSFTKDGAITGTGISRNASTKAITDKIAVIVIVLVLNLALFADLISVVIILL